MELYTYFLISYVNKLIMLIHLFLCCYWEAISNKKDSSQIINLIPLISISVFMSKPCGFCYCHSVVQHMRDGDFSRYSIIVQDFDKYPWLFCFYVCFGFQYKVEYVFLKVCKVFFNFHGDYVESVEYFS